MSLFNRSPAAIMRAQLRAMKFGKTKEQKKCIEFFVNNGQDGCLSGSMTIPEYLKLVENKANSIDSKARAIEKIGIDEEQISEIPPICLTNFRFDDDCHVVVGKSKKDTRVSVVSSQYSIAWLFFSSTQMYVYTYIFDMVSNNVWEYCREFYYTDITCFLTVHRVKEKIDAKFRACLGVKPIHSDYDVDSLKITVPGVEYTVWMRDNPEAVNSIYAARSYIREKKYMQ